MISTARLDLVIATSVHLDAELEGARALASALGAEVPDGWPPGQHDSDAVGFFRDRLATEGEAATGWYAWYGIARATGSSPRVVVAAAGFMGPPRDGVVEIGYSVVEAFRGRGFATEMMTALVARAFEITSISRAIAHTTSDNVGSRAVLEKLGFRADGDGEEPGTIRFARPRASQPNT